MDDRQEEAIEETVVNAVTATVLPLLSWCLRQFAWAMFGCKLTLILRHPTKEYRQLVVDLWDNGNQFSSGEEVVSFLRTSGRRHYRKRWKKNMIPFFREMRNRPECLLLRRRFQEKWNTLHETNYKIPPELPRKVTKEFDIADMEKRRNEEFCNCSRDDILDTFPIDQTVRPRMVNRVVSEVGNYGQTVHGIWWEASRDWNLIRQIGINKNSSIWEILDLDPNGKPDIEGLIDWSLDFALGKWDNDRVTRLARWVMGRIVVSQFLEYAYSEKKLVSLETPVADGLTVGDMLPDNSTQEELLQKEDDEIVSMAVSELPASQREASELFLRADSKELRQKLGDKKYEAVERNFERALRKLREPRESGRLDA